MTLGTNHLSNTTSTSVGYFIPELWADDVIAAYKTATVMAPLVRKISFKGKRGDTLNIPNPTRGSANDKAVGSQVTLNEIATAEISVVVNKWKESSHMMEDIIDAQSLPSLRRFFTDDAGFAIAKAVDQDLHSLSAYFQSGSVAGATNLFETGKIGGDGSTAFSGASGGNGTALTDAGIRNAIQVLDDGDVPGTDRHFVVPPVSKNTILGLSRFTEQAFVGNGMAIRSGQIANLYGVDVYVSTNCPWIHCNSVTDTQSVTFTSTKPTGSSYADFYGLTVDWTTSSPTDTTYRVAPMFHREANVLAEQVGVRSQAQYLQQYLGWLYTADMIYGVKTTRNASGVSLVVPS